MDIPRVSDFKTSGDTLSKRLKRRFFYVSPLFLFTVLIPTLLATVYFAVLASDVYVSESRFVVRNPQRQSPVGLGALLQGAGFVRSQDDTYSVYDFMLSRDALRELNGKLALGAAFGNKTVDFLTRFDPAGMDHSFESLYLYYQKRVDIHVDTASSISSLKVSAFTAQDAYRINASLLEMGERLVNELNERGRQDMIRFAASEAASAAKAAKAASLALSVFRSTHALFDPERQSALQLQHVSKLQDDLIATKLQLEQVRTFTAQNPQIPALQKRIAGLQSEIAGEMGSVAGTNTSLMSKVAEYERLTLERTVADKQLAMALSSLEQARNEAQRKQLYLERIVQPNLPDIAVQPRRMRAILATFILGLVAWGVLSVLIAGVREHHD